jgi:hypothetical protein
MVGTRNEIVGTGFLLDRQAEIPLPRQAINNG